MATDPPNLPETRDRLIEEIVRFVRQLRAAGVNVPADGGLAAARALGTVGISDETRARTALHAALVASETGREPFDRLFDAFWYRIRAILRGAVQPPGGDSSEVPDDIFAPLGGEAGGHAADPAQPTGTGSDEPGAGGEEDRLDDLERAGVHTAKDQRVTNKLAGDVDPEADGEGSAATYSPAGTSEQVAVDHAAVIGGDPLTVHVDELGEALSLVRGRRWTTDGDRRPDVRRALRTSVSAGGALVPVPEQEKARTATRATVLVDVSQSVLDTIDRGFLIRFLRLVVARWRMVRVFFFDTDIREVTAALDAPTAAAAIQALEEAETAWGGGTRIGHALTRIRTEFPDVIDRRTTVLVISDGLEVGDVSTLEEGAVWVGDRAESVWWLNPLAADHAYEPTVRGMAAALPHIDGLFAFTEPGDVAELARQLRVQGPNGRVGYQFDPRRSNE